MIPFANTWPYETIGDDVYVSECPFCGAENIILPLKKKKLPDIRGKKHLLVLPCCRSSVYIVDVDSDYLLANKRLRK